MKKKQAKQSFDKKNIAINAALLFGIFVSMTVALSALWVNRSFFDTQRFSNTVTTSLTSESSRNAIAAEATDRILADRPITRRLLGSQITSLVAASLNSDLANNSMLKLSQRVQLYMTSSDQQSVVLELGGIKDITSKFIGILGKEDGTINTAISNAPDTIILLDEEKIPSLYSVSVAFLWLGPLAVIAVIACVALLLYRNRKSLYTWAYAISGSLLVAAIFGLLYGPLFRPPVTSAARTINGRVVVGNLYDAFMGQFASIMYVLLYTVLIALAALFIAQNFKKIKALVTK
jgi:hypothetical protein